MYKVYAYLRVVFVAVFVPFAAFAEDFNITYELNGGTAATTGMPTTYTAGTEASITGVPTRTGSTFAGWCTDAELTDCANPMIIGADATGDKTFYASWTCKTGYGAADDGQSCTANEYTVTYDCGDGAGTAPANAIATYNANFSPVMIMKNLCEKSGYVLSGWLVSGTSTVQAGTFKWTYTVDKTLTAQWVEFDPKFTVTTTNMSAGDTFKYWQGATGKFYVDWGDGTLQTINYKAVIPHTYETAGVHTIRFGGLATGYSTVASETTPNAIGFGIRSVYKRDATTNAGTPLFVAGISGSLGDIYPSLPNDNHPRFMSTFNGCTNLTGSIPAELFRGVTGSKTDKEKNYAMFTATFQGCSGLTGSIPADLFGDLNNAATGMSIFQQTFSGCSGLTGSIPAGLFSGVTGIPRAGLFAQTFANCSGLTGSIPENLFATISGSANDDITSYTITGDTTYTRGAVNAFGGTFGGCENLTGTIPAGLFSGITGNAAYLFNATFAACQSISGTIPAGLFSGITGAAPSMFKTTFQGMCGIESPIPSNLFAGVSGTAKEMFRSTFNMGRCGAVGGRGLPESGLTGYVDPQLFAGVTGSSANIFNLTFRNTQMDTTCPCGDHSVTTAWGIEYIGTTAEGDRMVAVCAPGLKPNEHYYTGDNGDTVCTTDCDFATNFKTETGLSYNLLSTQVTAPSLVFKSGNSQCYVPLATGNSAGSVNLKWGNNTYHVAQVDPE